MKKTSTLIRLGTLTVAAIFVIGCHEDGKPHISINDDFKSDSEPRTIDNYFNRQAEIAAREDGTLYAMHFTGDQLNSLGIQKLNLITGPGNAGVATVYLDIPKDNTYGPRQDAVASFFNKKGVSSDNVKLVAGPNPAGTPASIGITGLSKQSGDASAAGAAPVATK